MPYCDSCNYTCSRKNDFERHLLTIKHIKNTSHNGTITKSTDTQVSTVTQVSTDTLLTCNACKFTSDNVKYYNRHLQTARHKKLCDPIHIEFLCDCGESFASDRSRLFHQKKCGDTHPTVIGKESTIKQLMEHIIKQDQQLERMNETLGTIAAKPTVTNNIININIFLSDQCKNAIDLDTFFEMLSVDVSDVEKLKESKNIQSGVKDIFARAIDQLSVTERPFQCVDVKRNTMYVNKKDDGWIKDENNDTSMQLIDHIIDTYKHRLPDWMQDNPELAINSHPKQDIFKALVDIVYSERTTYNDNQILKYISHKTACTKEIRTRESQITKND